MRNINRRDLLGGAACAVAAMSAGPAFAQFKPARPIEFVVHCGPQLWKGESTRPGGLHGPYQTPGGAGQCPD